MQIKRVRGDSNPLKITLENMEGNPVDLTGSTVFFTVKRNMQDTDANALIAKSTTTHTSAVDGETQITLTTTDTDITGTFYYDVQVKNSDGEIFSVIADKIIFVDDVTKRTS